MVLGWFQSRRLSCCRRNSPSYRSFANKCTAAAADSASVHLEKKAHREFYMSSIQYYTQKQIKALCWSIHPFRRFTLSSLFTHLIPTSLRNAKWMKRRLKKMKWKMTRRKFIWHAYSTIKANPSSNCQNKSFVFTRRPIEKVLRRN